MTFDLTRFYDDFPRVEAEFDAALDESLRPRGPEMLYDLVAEFGLAPGSRAVDVGCGEGEHTERLATRFGFDVLGVDPVPRHVELTGERAASGTRERAASGTGERAASGIRVRAVLGSVERLPVGDGTTDLIWCRDVLVHVSDLDLAYAEFRRVLRPGGRALIYQMYATDLLEPREAAAVFATMGVVPASADPRTTERAIAAAGLRVDACLELGPEWGEFAAENGGDPGRKLLNAARLRRDPARYIARFGAEAYEIMLGDSRWHVYRMLGKLSPRVYLLTAP